MKTVADVREFLKGRIKSYDKALEVSKGSSIEDGKQALGLAINMIIEEAYLDACGKSLNYIYHAPSDIEEYKIRSYIRLCVDQVLLDVPCTSSGHSPRIHDNFHREGYRRFWKDYVDYFPEKRD